MPTILVTRPQKQANMLADLLRQMGYNCVISSLLTLAPTHTPMPSSPPPEAVMITSSNVFDFAPNLSSLTSLPCFCVGKRTAESARLAGFNNVYYTSSDGQVLAALISETLPASAHIMHIAARDIASAGQHALLESGYNVTIWPVYQADTANILTTEAQALINNGAIDAVMLFSARTAETFGQLLRRNGLEGCGQRMFCLGLSEATLAPLAGLTWRGMAAALVPTEESMIECLKQHCPIA